MAPMPLTGTIGITSSLKADGEGSGHPFRRSLPEPVVTFHLPTIRRLPSQGDKASRKGKQAIKGIETLRERDDSEDKLSIESSLVLLQSLRQSRLIHLTALLPYLSTRHRTSTKYHPSPPDHPFPGGLDPSVTPHSLLHLGRADVRIGPLVFPKTRFGEVRVEGPVQSSGQSTSKTITATDKGEEVKAPPSAPQAQSTSISKPSAPTSEPPPPIDDAVVKAVSKAAQNDPELQALLHTAANGKANPEELRKLAGVINIISEGLNKSKKKKDIAPSKPAKKSAMSTNSSMAPNASASSATQDTSAHHHVPPPPNDPPSYPPIITIEFRENPSARFILPLWRGCAVEMYRNGEERSIKVTMLLPAIGSTAATRAGPNFNSTPPARKGKGAEIKSEGNKASPTNPPTKEQLTAPAPPGAETHAVTWHISGNRDNPLPDGIWHIFGRVSGTKVIVDGKVVPTRGTDQTDEDFVQQSVNKLKVSRSEMPHTPQLQLAPSSLSREMADHLADKFAPRMQTLVSKPVVKLKRGEADDDEVEVLRDSGKRTRTSGHKPARANGGGGAGEEESRKRYSTAASVGDLHEGDTMMDEEADTPSKPKRKRHVAKFNPDGTLKLCQACGTNTTPMWRRGPAGKSTLCNACGAKWKVGRLVVSSDGLAPVASTLRAQKLEEAFQSHHIIDAEAVTGTDPQTTSKPNQLAAEGLDKVANGTTV